MRNTIVLLLVIPLLCACGKKGALIYPDMLLPAAPASVTARQAGDAVRLSFIVSRKDRGGRSISNLAGVRIFRREALPAGGANCPACTDDYTLFRKLYLDLPETGVENYDGLILLMDGDVRRGRDYTYRVVPFTKDALDGAASAPVTAAMVEPPPPPLVRAESAPTEIRIDFVRPQLSAGVLVGYNIYRARAGEPFPLRSRNSEPLTDAFVDTLIERHVSYRYAARTVVRLPAGGVVESALSAEVLGELLEE